MKRPIEMEDQHGDEQVYWMETEGTTVDISPSFRWKCLVVLLFVAAVVALVRFMAELVWG